MVLVLVTTMMMASRMTTMVMKSRVMRRRRPDVYAAFRNTRARRKPVAAVLLALLLELRLEVAMVVLVVMARARTMRMLRRTMLEVSSYNAICARFGSMVVVSALWMRL